MLPGPGQHFQFGALRPWEEILQYVDSTPSECAYVHACMCACVCVYVDSTASECAYVRACMCACMCERVCAHALGRAFREWGKGGRGSSHCCDATYCSPCRTLCRHQAHADRASLAYILGHNFYYVLALVHYAHHVLQAPSRC